MSDETTRRMWIEYDKTREQLKQVSDALKVLVLTPGIRAHLEATDPKALAQAEKALAETGFTVPAQQAADRTTPTGVRLVCPCGTGCGECVHDRLLTEPCEKCPVGVTT